MGAKGSSTDVTHVVSDHLRFGFPGQFTLEAFDWLRRSFCSNILEYLFRSFLICCSKGKQRNASPLNGDVCREKPLSSAKESLPNGVTVTSCPEDHQGLKSRLSAGQALSRPFSASLLSSVATSFWQATAFLKSPPSSGFLPQRTPHLYLILGEQSWRPGSPQQLAETVFVVFLEEATLESPQPVGVVHLRRAFWSGEGILAAAGIQHPSA